MIKEVVKTIEKLRNFNEEDIVAVYNSNDKCCSSYEEYMNKAEKKIKDICNDDHFVIFGFNEMWFGESCVEPISYDFEMFKSSLKKDVCKHIITVYANGSFGYKGFHDDGVNYYQMIPLSKFNNNILFDLIKDRYSDFSDFVYELVTYMKRILINGKCNNENTMLCKYYKNSYTMPYLDKEELSEEEFKILENELRDNKNIQKNIKDFFIYESNKMWGYF